MNCRDIAPLLDAFRTSEANVVQEQQVREHLAVCEACARDAAFIEQVARDARAAVRHSRSEARDLYGVVETDIGPVWIAFRPTGITFLHLRLNTGTEFEEVYRKRTGREARPGPVPAAYRSLVEEAVSGTLRRRVPVDISTLAPFEKQVLEVLRQIPPGEVRTYAWLAREAGRPAAVRAAGNAMARNPIPLLLPCHRAVPTAGGTGNYAFGSELKRQLLTREGVPLSELDELARSGTRYIGSSTTQIFCFPTCRAARRIQPHNRVMLAGASAATAAGYRPCMLCRPA